MKLWVQCMFVIVLAACESPMNPGDRFSDFLETKRAYDQEIAACERSFPDQHKKPVTPRVRCFNQANMALAAGKRDVDLVHAMTTQMLVEAEKYDAGKLTPAAYDASRAAVFADYRTKVLQRRNSAAMVEAAEDQADAARAQARAAMNPPSRTTTCSSIGSTITCY